MFSLSTAMILSTRNQMLIAFILIVLMFITRGHHFADMHNLPGASWAVFFLAGVYLRTLWSLPGLLALSWWLDFAAYTWGGASGFCLTPAYVFLLPAYTSLWLAGCWYAGRYQFSWSTLPLLSLCILAGLTVCELFSSGGFYFFSGHFTDTTWVEFVGRSLIYFPMYIESFLFYIAIAMVIHVFFVLIYQQYTMRSNAAG